MKIWAAALMVMTVAACSSNMESDAPGKALFAELPAATPDKLRGVWALKTHGETADAEIRLRFTENKIVGGVRCTSNTGDTIMIIGGEVASTTDDLDKKSGSFTMAATLSMDGKDRYGNTCTGKLDAATWSFAVSGTNVKITSIDPKGSSSLDKVGD